ncbi:hypothetical protein HLB44_14185 [Aquincola sp. S2]|uniref:Uncharacterized protein n=1 Tax=Pseudaquabacterium terrae TaxID=2732868 RepID=A0ABX2EHP5_9BURK|nr:hypothetical protein [Aquabacterium terrae]NRF68138.1 hypothetical protein [Aquabacterium terrae]
MKRLPLVLYALVATASLAFASLQPPHVADIEAGSVKLAAVAVDALEPVSR